MPEGKERKPIRYSLFMLKIRIQLSEDRIDFFKIDILCQFSKSGAMSQFLEK